MPEKTNLVVKHVGFAYHVISVTWIFTDRPDEIYTSNLYLHCDGKLKIDSETAKFGRKFGTEFLRQVFSHRDYEKAMKKKKKEPYVPCDYTRVENILRKDEMYKKAIRRLNAEKEREGRSRPVSLWMADGLKDSPREMG